jgi:small subunit ribosomal protein S6
MRAYELMVIFDGDLDENIARQWIKRITDAVKAQGGNIVGTPDWWGKRAFAYEINKKQQGFYCVFNLLAPGGALDEVERSFRLADEVVRHKLIRLPDHEAERRGMVGAAAAG